MYEEFRNSKINFSFFKNFNYLIGINKKGRNSIQPFFQKKITLLFGCSIQCQGVFERFVVAGIKACDGNISLIPDFLF